jgi:hypothetical protein
MFPDDGTIIGATNRYCGECGSGVVCAKVTNLQLSTILWARR